jgi:predicted nucleotide-binding protein
VRKIGAALRPEVSAAHGKAVIVHGLETGLRLSREGVEIAQALGGADSTAGTVASGFGLPAWQKQKSGWVNQTAAALEGVFGDSDPARRFSGAAQVARTAPAFGTERLRREREAVDRGINVLRVLAEHLRSDRVMVIHGRNEPARAAVFGILSALGLEPIEWDDAVKESGKASPHNLEAVRAAMDAAQVIVALFTPDDIAHLRHELADTPEEARGQARPNVLIETGMALALKPKDTILVHAGASRPVTDLDGLNYVSLPDRLSSLANRLKDRGCRIDMSSDALGRAKGFAEALELAGFG